MTLTNDVYSSISNSSTGSMTNDISNGITNGESGYLHNGDKPFRRRPIVVAGCSGGTVDRSRALLDLSKLPEIDVITGDWMSEADMTVNGTRRSQLKKEIGSIEALGLSREAYHGNFLEKIQPALKYLAQNNTKVVCNAGGSNPHGLAEAVKELIKQEGLTLRVAWVEGDDVTEPVVDLIRSKTVELTNITTGKDIHSWGFEPISAQCYLGASGIAQALKDSDIIICGRVADSSPCIGAAIWWHGWEADNYKALASSLVAGHLIECSTYATGGCYSGFKKWQGKAVDLGFPIAHISHTGDFEISKEPGRDGEVSVETLTTQLVYEIQGPLYYNSTVVACLEGIRMESVGPDRVRVTRVEGLPPPPTTKVGITALGGYRAEYHIYLTGLDIKEKAEMVKTQTIAAMGPKVHQQFKRLEFQVVGSPDPDARSQDAATVDLRIFAQASDPELLAPGKFLTWCKMNILQGCPGLTPVTDPRQGTAKPYYEYWVALLDQSLVKESVHLHDGEVLHISSPAVTRTYPSQQKSYDPSDPVSAETWGPTTRVPLGYVVLGRSGDKSSDANLGLFVRHDDEWDWLRSTFTISKLKELLADDYLGKPIDRFEIPGLKAVHFLLHDHLDGGYSAGSTLDCLGKNLVEYIRAKAIDVPVKFVERGRI
ncbi:uncharacterized protein Z518_04693 [Rhinocladiella mackenziei CBS 650.93]|uniref:Rhinocladiella mackenziei CBS 650.93 unplaced genomic scaffold supercont1.3, whole genome shotgun sequence n=1 Tax=Rhinocladiella mackenziei CBS 650.93 TaxID=1442369 RepID=A0A0D2FWR7_9EURO|nr:uncharacterized protein Z518_04693 [Rhinocladiella mackenziei CBS 650.93]KIX06717.1 hypothetical protein Z518_04693 [Rhinocladiella mackenziei CBS 650.93]